MKKASAFVLAPKLSTHSYNADRTMCAVCPYDSTIIIYDTKGSENAKDWKKKYELKEHDHLVTCLDWAPKTNRILSCSQDRNAYVWSFDKDSDSWKQSLVLLRINRAATTCKWSASEDKFCVGSGTKILSVCYFEEENNWWVSKMIKKHRSTVTCADWHPQNNTIVASGSSDFKCRVFSAFVKSVDSKDDKVAGFGKVLYEYKANSWVNDVKFSPSGKYLAFASQNSKVTIVEYGTENVQTVRHPQLPSRALCFVSDTVLIAAGHEYVPIVFTLEGDEWKLKGIADHGQYKSNKSANRRSTRAAFLKFQGQDSVGTTAVEDISTRHENTILGLEALERNDDGSVKSFSSLGVAGRIFQWDVEKVLKEAK